MYVPPRKQVAAVLPLGIVNFRTAVLLFQQAAEVRKLDGLTVFDKAVFGNRSDIDKEMVVAAAVAAAVKHHAAHKAASLHIVIELAGDIARKIPSAPRIGVVFVHIGAKIAVERALRALVCREVKVPRVGLAEQHDLERVDNGGLARAVAAGQKVHVPDLDQLAAEIQPVNQQYLLQLLHRFPPPFAEPPRPRAAAPPKPRSEWSAEWRTGSPAGCIFPRCAE